MKKYQGSQFPFLGTVGKIYKKKKKRQRNRGINSLETKANLYFPLVLKEVPLPPLYVLYD